MASPAQILTAIESSTPTPTTYKPWDTARIRDGLGERACLLIGGAPFANKKERRVVGWMRFAFEASGVEPHVIKRCALLESVDAVEPPFGLKVKWNDVRQDVCTAIMRQCYGGYPPPVATGWHPLLSKFRLRSVGKKWDPFGGSQKGKGGKKKGKKRAKKKTAAKKPAANVVPPDPARDPTKPSSRFWGVTWSKGRRRWQVQYTDANGKKRYIGLFDDEEEAARARDKAIRDAGLEGQRRTNAVDATGALVPRTVGVDRSAVVAPDPARAPSAASSRFWGVIWCKRQRRWVAQYTDANGKTQNLGSFDTQEAAAHAVNAGIRRAGLEGKRRMNAVDATGALVPRERKYDGDRAAVVAPDPARDPTATSSKFWGVTWAKRERRWQAGYKDANGKQRFIGLFDTQEAAAHAVNAAIRRAGLEGRRKTNPVVDGQLVPKKRKANGHGPPRKSRKRGRSDEPAAATPSPRARSDEPAAATPSPRARRQRRAVNFDDFELDDDDDEDLELAPSDDEDGWD